MIFKRGSFRSCLFYASGGFNTHSRIINIVCYSLHIWDTLRTQPKPAPWEGGEESHLVDEFGLN